MISSSTSAESVLTSSQSTHFYWNVAAPRAIIPGAMKTEEYFQPIEPGFASYSKDNFEFILGAATAVDPAANTVSVTTASAGDRTLNYDFLVLATGARAPTDDVLWKNPGTYEEGTSKLRAIGERVQAAQSYVIGGAGMTGVETAAELKYEYGGKEVTLICAGPELLNGDSLASGAESQIAKLGVKIRKDVKVTGSTPGADGKTEVALSDGSTISTDMYIPTVGVVPNSEFLPASMLTERKYVSVDEHFRVKGHQNIWAAGDVVSIPRATFGHTDKTVRDAMMRRGYNADSTLGRRCLPERRCRDQGQGADGRQAHALRRGICHDRQEVGRRAPRLRQASLDGHLGFQVSQFGEQLYARLRQRLQLVETRVAKVLTSSCCRNIK